MRMALQREEVLNAERDGVCGAKPAGRRAIDAMASKGAETVQRKVCSGDGKRESDVWCAAGGEEGCDSFRRLGCGADGWAAGVAAGGGADTAVLRCRSLRWMMRGYGQAFDAAGGAGHRSKHQQENQREGELCSARHRYPV
jgi:hypothetical protein